MSNHANHKNFLSDPLPESIYFDTNFVVHALIKQESEYFKNLTCRYFINRLLASKTKIYFSAIIFPEFWHSTLKIAIARDMGYTEAKDVHDYLKSHKKEALKKHTGFIKEKQASFDDLMAWLNKAGQRVFVIETQRTISEEALRFMEHYQLLSYDAIHFASATIKISPKSDADMIKPSIFDIASIDGDFERIECEYLNIWHNGCDYNSILKYEKTLSPKELQPDGILGKIFDANKNLEAKAAK